MQWLATGPELWRPAVMTTTPSLLSSLDYWPRSKLCWAPKNCHALERRLEADRNTAKREKRCPEFCWWKTTRIAGKDLHEGCNAGDTKLSRLATVNRDWLWLAPLGPT